MRFDVFPTGDLFDPETEIWRLVGQTISGGASSAGLITLARTDGGGLWTCRQTGIEIYETRQLLAASALDMQLEGGASPIVVPCFNWPLRPLPDGARFAVAVELASAATLRATSLTVVLTAAGPLRGGEPFSMTHEGAGKRLYRVHSAEAPETSEGVTTQVITVRPPLREAEAPGAALDFNNPGCVMRLTNPADWLSPLNPAHEQTAQPVWVEHFDRPEPSE